MEEQINSSDESETHINFFSYKLLKVINSGWVK